MKYVGIWVVVCLLPQIAWASVRITEVAWMGTEASQYAEWLELYNDADTPINLSGWKLYEGDGSTLVYTFSKTIGGQSYLLLERTTASVPDAVPGIQDESGPFGGGGLANTGEDLVLRDATGALVDELSYLGGWPAGDAKTKETMQRVGDAWVTAPPTPKASPKEDSAQGETDSVEDTSQNSDPYPIPKVSPNKPQIVFTVPSIVYTGVPYTFSAEPVLEYNYHIQLGDGYWNFGDGTTVYQSVVGPVQHTYQFPGTYTLFYQYTDPYIKNTPLSGVKKITVSEPKVSVSITHNSVLEFSNQTTSDIDLTGWSVSLDGRYVVLPKNTIIAAKSHASISSAVFGVPVVRNVFLIDPSGSHSVQIAGTTPYRTSGAPAVTESFGEKVESELLPDLVAQAPSVDTQKEESPTTNRTKTIIFGAIAVFVIGLSILLERAMARREY